MSDLIDQLDVSSITSVYEDEAPGYRPYHPVMLRKVQGPVRVAPPAAATIVDRMSRKLHTKTGAAVYAARKGIVEPAIGQIKLVCTTHNILKLYRLCR